MDGAMEGIPPINVLPERRGRGRPRKNPGAPRTDNEPAVKRPRGRPKGSGKPKPPVEKKVGSVGRGRPKGSKNKPKIPGAIPLASEKAKSRARVGRPPSRKDKTTNEIVANDNGDNIEQLSPESDS